MLLLCLVHVCLKILVCSVLTYWEDPRGSLYTQPAELTFTHSLLEPTFGVRGQIFPLQTQHCPTPRGQSSYLTTLQPMTPLNAGEDTLMHFNSISSVYLSAQLNPTLQHNSLNQRKSLILKAPMLRSDLICFSWSPEDALKLLYLKSNSHGAANQKQRRAPGRDPASSSQKFRGLKNEFMVSEICFGSPK